MINSMNDEKYVALLSRYSEANIKKMWMLLSSLDSTFP